MNEKLTISLQGDLMELVHLLEEPAAVVPAAVRQYVVDLCLQRLDSAEGKVGIYVQRYGMDNYTEHIHELVPHRHGPDKSTTTLTETWEARRFLLDLKDLLTQ
jgi:hypothetical protein